MSGRPALVVSDAHLARGAESRGSRDLARLIESHPGHELLLNGDTLNLSSARPECSQFQALRELLAGHPELCRAMSSHLLRGDAVTFIAGNHDAALMEPSMRFAILRQLDLPDDVPLRTRPWFVRRGAVHVEHGHVYDPDNAPTHPLAPMSFGTEPLGVAMTRRLLAAKGVDAFAHEHETTFWSGLVRAFRRYGMRAPTVVTDYYACALGLWLEAGVREDIERERALGERAVEAAAADVGLAHERLRELIGVAARPTHHSRLRTFRRLYLDRTLAGALLAGSMGGAMVTGAAAARWVAVPSAAYLAGSVLRRPNRYRGQLAARLRACAHRVAQIVGARQVVFGHSHEADADDAYCNPGPFGLTCPGARPYLVIDEHGHVDRRFC